MLLQAYRGVLSARGVNIYEEVDRIDWTEVSEGVDKKNDGKVAPGPSNEVQNTSDTGEGKENKKALSFFKRNKSGSGDKSMSFFKRNKSGSIDKDKEGAKNQEKKTENPGRLKDCEELPITEAGKSICGFCITFDPPGN